MYRVVIQVLKTGEYVPKEFDSYEFCRQFVRKCRYSKRVRLVSYPNYM